METLDFISLFGIALVGGFGHCIGMCGGIVLAFSGKLAKNNTNKGGIAISHLLYNLGRISTYVLLGALVGGLGSMFSLNGTLRGALFVVAGFLMVLAGLSLFGKSKFLTFLEHSVQNSKWYQMRFQNALNLKTPFSLYVLGLLNGLLPCGFVYAFLFSAASFASVFKGALVMLIFGIATIVPLLLFGILANTILYKPFLRKLAMNLAAISIVIFGVLMIEKGVRFLQNPQMSHKMHQMQDSNTKSTMHDSHSPHTMESKEMGAMQHSMQEETPSMDSKN